MFQILSSVTVALAVSVAPRPAVGEDGATAAASEARAGDYEGLLDEYDDVLRDWKDQYKDAAMDERRELKARHPAREYWPRFEALAAAGEGRAYLWMADSLRDKGLKVSQVREEKRRIYELLIEEYAATEWFGEVLERLPGERRSLAEGQAERTFRATIEGSPHRAVQAHAMYLLSATLYKNKGELSQAESERWMEKLAAEYEETDHGAQASGILFERRHLVVGKIAPDFEGKTIDGHTFKLSDYRGKVVLLDFYGFW